MQLKVHVVTIEDLVPENHFVRKLEANLDLRFVREELGPLYSARFGHPAIDPVVLVKYLLLGYLYNIESEREIERRCAEQPSFRWYLGVDLFERVPDHSTISQNRRRRKGFEQIFRRLFSEVVAQCLERGLVEGRLLLTDSTHVKANASRRSEVIKEVEASTGAYFSELDAYESAERKRRQAYKRVYRKKETPMKERRVSTTDPEAGFLNRPGKPRGQHYLLHQTVDPAHGIILGVTVTPGDVSDNVPYLPQLRQVKKQWDLPVEAAAADSAHDFSLAHQVLSEQGIRLYTPPIPPHSVAKVAFTRAHFQYDALGDFIVVPTENSCAHAVCVGVLTIWIGFTALTGLIAGCALSGNNAWRHR